MKLVNNMSTVIVEEPPNKGHFGTSHFVHCREVVLFSEFVSVLHVHSWGYWGSVLCKRGCPFLGESFVRGSTVLLLLLLLLL